MSGFDARTMNDPRAGYYDALHEAEMRGARIVLDAIADTGFFGITGEYGDIEKRDAFIRRVLARTTPAPAREEEGKGGMSASQQVRNRELQEEVSRLRAENMRLKAANDQWRVDAQLSG